MSIIQLSRLVDMFSRIRAVLLKQNCDGLKSKLEKNWAEMTDVERFSIILVMLDEKRCDTEMVIPFLLKLLSTAADPFYREQSISKIAELDGIRYRNVLIEAFRFDPDQHVRIWALEELNDKFRDQEDIEILKLALKAYDDPESILSMRLAAGAAMMYQLGIPHDEQGRPAWWHEDEEELEHPAMQKAVSTARQLLQREGEE